MTVQQRLARPVDAGEQRRIKRLWVRHSIAEERRDIEGLIATLSADCRYEIVPTGQRWDGHAGARQFYTELFGAFPDNAFALSEIVIGPQGVFEVATLTGTNQGPWAGVPPSGLAVALEVLILFPWDAATERFLEFAETWGERNPAIVRLWENAWAEFVPFLSFDVEIRKIICTTNAIVI